MNISFHKMDNVFLLELSAVNMCPNNTIKIAKPFR